MEAQIPFCSAAALSAHAASIAIIGIAAMLAPANAATFVTFNAQPHVQTTIPESINGTGEVVGSFVIPGGGTSGFLREPDGTMSFPSIFASATAFASINDNSDVVGSWTDSGNRVHCLVLFQAEHLKRCDIGANNDRPSEASSINNLRQVAGAFTGKDQKLHGFLWTEGDNIVTFDCIKDALETTPESINNNGVTVGGCEDKNGGEHGFIRSAEGGITIFDAPGGDPHTQQIFPAHINDTGVIVGNTFDLNANASHSFSMIGTSVEVFDPPGAIESTAQGINRTGEIVGTWTDQFSLAHGYVRTLNGSFRSFDAPMSLETTGKAINNAGVIAGNFLHKKSSKRSGYVRTPS